MISLKEAKDILIESINDLISKNNMQFTVGDLTAEINIIAVKYILANYKPMKDSNPTTYLSYNKQKYGNIARTFASALSDQYPMVLTDNVIDKLVDNICMGIGFLGVNDAVSDYMRTKHGVEIEDEGEKYDFTSSHHERYQYGSFVEASNVQRLVHITASYDWQQISVSIIPTLTTKKALLNNKEGNKLYFKGEDPDFCFMIELDDFEEVIFFSLERKDKCLRLDYYE